MGSRTHLSKRTPARHDHGRRPKTSRYRSTARGHKHDPIGRRTAETRGGVTTLYFYDGKKVALEYDLASPSTPLRYYVHGATYVDELAVLHDTAAGRDYAYALDASYSVVGVVADDGKLVVGYSYDVYGRQRVEITHGDLLVKIRQHLGETPGPVDCDLNTDGTVNVLDLLAARTPPGMPSGQPYAFQGRRLAVYATLEGVELPLYDFRARSYDPILGRFMQRDPSDYVDSYNLYLALGGNPLVYLDPTGEFSYGSLLSVAAIGSRLYGMYDTTVTTIGYFRQIAAGVSFRSVMFDMALSAATTFVGGKLLDKLIDLVAPVVRKAGALVVKKIEKEAARRRMAVVRKLGKEGEKGIAKNTEHIPSATGKAEFRIPDEWVEGEYIKEVKNVGYLSHTSQIEDFWKFAQEAEIDFILRIRENTKLSKPIKDLIAQGKIKLDPVRLPAR
ncbi:MAG: hypothetical protein JXQ73_06145 [Phycisphaerae bacterium]|nr:hypothetical protein [Phycisphaerae bacterium]